MFASKKSSTSEIKPQKDTSSEHKSQPSSYFSPLGENSAAELKKKLNFNKEDATLQKELPNKEKMNFTTSLKISGDLQSLSPIRCYADPYFLSKTDLEYLKIKISPRTSKGIEFSSELDEIEEANQLSSIHINTNSHGNFASSHTKIIELTSQSINGKPISKKTTIAVSLHQQSCSPSNEHLQIPDLEYKADEVKCASLESACSPFDSFDDEYIFNLDLVEPTILPETISQKVLAATDSYTANSGEEDIFPEKDEMNSIFSFNK